ncbi:MAG: TldD/PmbA family protein [Myxococcota bacterium]
MRDEAEVATLLARARDAVDLARSAGAVDVFAEASRGRSVEFRARNGVIEKVTEATTRSLSLEVWVDGRYGASSTTDLRADRLGSFVVDVVDLTRALEPDPDRRIADPALYAGRSTVDLALADDAVRAVTREEHLAVLAALAAETVGEDGVLSAAGSSSTYASTAAAVSSNGFEGITDGTSQWLGADVTMRDEGDKRPEAGMSAGARFRADLPDPASVGQQALAWARARVGAEKGQTVTTALIVHPRVAARLIGGLLAAADGAAVQQGRSFWTSRMDRAVVSPLLTITDDPLVPKGLGSRLWDNEGLAAKALPLIADGRLQNLYLDTTYARKLGRPPTTGTSSNRMIGLGTRDLPALLGAASSAIHVTSWLGGNLNDTTGDFSFGLRGHKVDRGVVGAPVSEMNVTGNIVDLFASLVEVGSDPWPYGTTRSPTLVFENVQFSGV